MARIPNNKQMKTSIGQQAKGSAPNSSSPARSVAQEIFNQARSGLSSAGLREGPVAFSYLFRQLSVYLRLRPGQSMPSVDGKPLPLSPQGQKMDALARSLAERTVSLCKQKGLMPADLSQVMDELYTLSTDPALEASLRSPAHQRSPSTPRPTSPALPPSSSTSRSSSPTPPPSPASRPTSSAAQPSLTFSPPIRTARRRISTARLQAAPSSLSLLQSLHAPLESGYSARLADLAKDLRQLLVEGPRLFGPIPVEKKVYVEQLIAFIEESERDFKVGKTRKHFCFSPEEKHELEYFSPAFKLCGLDWLEMERPRST